MTDRREELCGLLARIGARTKEAKAAKEELSGEVDRLYDACSESIPEFRHAAMSGDPDAENVYLQKIKERGMLM